MLAIDPSSPYTGGAIMGDRVRMMEHAADRDVFMRSMASRGELGGLAAATWTAAAALDAAGFDPILIETVGAGQSEVEIARLAETTVVVEVPEMGDEVQAIKAGLLEVADVIAVNKADRPGAQQAARQLRAMMSTAGGRVCRQPPRIIMTTAVSGEGVPALVDEIETHRRDGQSPEQAPSAPGIRFGGRSGTWSVTAPPHRRPGMPRSARSPGARLIHSRPLTGFSTADPQSERSHRLVRYQP